MSRFDPAPLRAVLTGLATQRRSALLPALHAAQRLYGCIPEEIAAEIGAVLGVSLAEVHGVIEFYSMFHRDPVGGTIVRVCSAPVCALAGGGSLLANLHDALNNNPNEREASFIIEAAPCLGLCNHAPACLVGDRPVGDAKIGRILSDGSPRPVPFVGGDMRRLTANCGLGHSVGLAEYRSRGGYAALQKALASSREEIIAEIKNSGLTGRGGAAFPTGAKWEAAATAAAEPKYVVCNADESEPGTFKDRVLMEDDPHRTLEGMIISAYAIGARQGYIYVRGEYAQAFATMSAAVDEARGAGILGSTIMGSAFDFDVEMRLGAGAYICGEETALFESIEGKRGLPRIKPPFPTTHGLFGKPTVINNVETFCNIPLIITESAVSYRKIGTEKSPGPKLFCLSGQIRKPGLYEVPFGITLRHLLFDLAGGIEPQRKLQAIFLGGAAGAFATEKDLDVILSPDTLASAGLPLGSGAVMVFDDSADIRDILKRIGHFFAEESCGKCYPCQLGTHRQYGILERIASGNTLPGDAERLSDIGSTMTYASLCGLGQTAATAVSSAMKLWPQLFASK